MVAPVAPFRESALWSTPLKDLGLAIAGTRLEPILAEFQKEVDRLGLQVKPHYYLSDEWGVPTGTVAIALPFYLARPELTELHARYVGHVEGLHRADILRYLRHEMGHVVNYAYRLYEEEAWVKLFGSMTQPYREDYRPAPFSRRYVRHLPGWYAQKHPDEDWAETFAVWMTPENDWRTDYAGWPTALAKLDYCERTLAALRTRAPVVTVTDLDESIAEARYSLEQYYGRLRAGNGDIPPGLDGALRAIFEDDEDASAPRRPASDLIRRHESALSANVYRWTGHFPERIRPLLHHLAERSDRLQLVYRAPRENELLIALTTLVTALAMNYVKTGTYFST
jgi:hypothetical protein